MDTAEAMAALPARYAEALRLRGAGLDDAGIAHALDVPVSAVANLLLLAEAKLSRLRGEPRGVDDHVRHGQVTS